MIRPETLSLSHDKVAEHQQASTIQFCLQKKPGICLSWVLY